MGGHRGTRLSGAMSGVGRCSLWVKRRRRSVTGLSLLYPQRTSAMSDTLSVSCQERSDTWRLFAEEPFTDGLLYQNKRLFSFLQLSCSQLRTKFRCRHFIFSRRYTRFSIRQGLRSILQLALGLT